MKRFQEMAIVLFLALGANLPALALSPSHLDDKIRDAASRWSLDPRLVAAIVKVESNFKETAKSPKGAMGLMQVMPKTASASGIHNPFHPLDNLMGACEYLRLLMNRYKRKLPLVLAAYNAGPRNVDRYQGVPPFKETQNYVKSVLAIYEQLKQQETP